MQVFFRYLSIQISILSVFLLHSSALAQTSSSASAAEDESLRTGIKQAVLPIVGFNSNFGLSVGGLLQRFDYGDGDTAPFENMTKYRFIFSTKNRFILKFDWEIIDNFGPDTRSLFIFEGLRFNEGSFFGIGNETPFSRSRFDQNLFFYQVRKTLVQYTGRKKLASLSNNGFIDGFLIGQVSFSKPKILEEESEFSLTRPLGFNGGWVNWLGFGFIADSRNNEFNPTKGIFARAQASLSDSFFQSDFNFGLYSFDFRKFTQLYPDIVLAQRIKLDHTTGSPPFWERPSLGSEEELRGFVDDRFFGDTSIAHTTEIRTWLIESKIFGETIRLGAQGFWDTGRVFSENDSNRFFKEWKHSYGGGIVYSLFTPDFIGRIDLGISGEISRLYFSAGYAF
ncbi:MAG: BamA/TamA family outer membrane protein [Balneolaceae bacterium]